MRLTTFYHSTVGKKVIMAVTGIIFVSFVIAHLAGNLLVFRGSVALNAYSSFLKSQAPLLWTARLVLLGSVALHILAAWQLTQRANTARPIAYLQRQPQASTWASRTLRIGGIVLLAFIVFHLLHFTTGTLHPDFREEDVYRNLTSGLRVWYVAAFYLLAMAALGMHLLHGVWSSLRTLGVPVSYQTPFRRRLATGVALLIWLGFSSIPLAVLFGALS